MMSKTITASKDYEIEDTDLWGETVGSILGGIAGGVAGATTLNPVGIWAGATAGATAGALGGKWVEDYFFDDEVSSLSDYGDLAVQELIFSGILAPVGGLAAKGVWKGASKLGINVLEPVADTVSKWAVGAGSKLSYGARKYADKASNAAYAALGKDQVAKQKLAASQAAIKRWQGALSKMTAKAAGIEDEVLRRDFITTSMKEIEGKDNYIKERTADFFKSQGISLETLPLARQEALVDAVFLEMGDVGDIAKLTDDFFLKVVNPKSLDDVSDNELMASVENLAGQYLNKLDKAKSKAGIKPTEYPKDLFEYGEKIKKSSALKPTKPGDVDGIEQQVSDLFDSSYSKSELQLESILKDQGKANKRVDVAGSKVSRAQSNLDGAVTTSNKAANEVVSTGKAYDKAKRLVPRADAAAKIAQTAPRGALTGSYQGALGTVPTFLQETESPYREVDNSKDIESYLNSFKEELPSNSKTDGFNSGGSVLNNTLLSKLKDNLSFTRGDNEFHLGLDHGHPTFDYSRPLGGGELSGSFNPEKEEVDVGWQLNFNKGGKALSNKISKIHGEGYDAPGQAYAIAKSMGYNYGGKAIKLNDGGSVNSEVVEDIIEGAHTPDTVYTHLPQGAYIVNAATTANPKFRQQLLEMGGTVIKKDFKPINPKHPQAVPAMVAIDEIMIKPSQARKHNDYLEAINGWGRNVKSSMGT